MRNLRSSNILRQSFPSSDFFDQKKILLAFKKLGFLEDFITNRLTVLRNTSFPFRRIVLPNDDQIHIELLKLYANDLGMNLDDLIGLID